MQIVVPAAGRGSRFVEQGYKEPKPLVEVGGKPLIKWSTDGLVGAQDAQFIFLLLQQHIQSHQIDTVIHELYPGCRVIAVDGVTQGAACTVLLAKQAMDINDSLLIVNCDNMFRIDIGKVVRDIGGTAEAALFYIAGSNSAWSYAQTNEAGYVVRTAEKEVISDRAIVGCYYFAKARYFIEAAQYMIAHDMRTRGEFYVSPVINILLSGGLRVKAYPCDLHFSLGTPEEVIQFKTIFFNEPVRISAQTATI